MTPEEIEKQALLETPAADADVSAAPEIETELSIAQAMRDNALPSPQQFHNVYLVNLRITGTGMAFRAEIKTDGKIIRAAEHVYRDPEIYLNDEFLARCNGLPVIMDHPEKNVLDAQEYEQRIAGSVFLPYIKGDEIWAIGKIYAQEAIDVLEDARKKKTLISTSPTVVFDETSENVKVMLESGNWLLLEGKPRLLDHIAICSLGVWDKGGPASGIVLDNRSLMMTPEEQAAADKAKADAEIKAKADDEKKETEKAEKAKADSETKAKADADLKAACDAAVKAARSDWEKEEKEKADKMKADSEEKAKADAEMMKADAGTYADAQARADSVYSMLGDRAPAPMVGETPMAYRIRLARKLQAHSARFKDINLTAIGDSSAFKVIEDGVYADSIASARNPIISGAGLREVKSTGPGGHQISEFYGDNKEWLSPFMQIPKCGRIHDYRRHTQA